MGCGAVAAVPFLPISSSCATSRRPIWTRGLLNWLAVDMYYMHHPFPAILKPPPPSSSPRSLPSTRLHSFPLHPPSSSARPKSSRFRQYSHHHNDNCDNPIYRPDGEADQSQNTMEAPPEKKISLQLADSPVVIASVVGLCSGLAVVLFNYAVTIYPVFLQFYFFVP